MISASADLLDLDMSGSNTLNNIMAMHNAKQQVQTQQQPFGQTSVILNSIFSK